MIPRLGGMMIIEKIGQFEPVVGDDKPFNTVYYSKVPTGFRFDDLVFNHDMYENVSLIWEDMKKFLNLYFEDWEINAKTFKDFFNGLNISLMANIESMEKRLSAILLISPDAGSKVTRTKSGTRQESGTNTKNRTYSDSVENSSSGSSENIVMAFDSANTDPSQKTIDNQATNNKGTGTENQTDNNTVSGSDSESESIVTDEDSLSYYERLTKLYPSIPMEFVNIFKENFTLSEALIW